jgi:hypothetical protein
MKFSCEICLYSTNTKCCFEKHKKSKTHIQKENNDFEENFECNDCHKKYKTNMGLWKHKKICESIKKRLEDEEKKRKEEERKRKDEEEIRKIVIDLYKQNNEIIKDNAELKKDNAEMKNMLLELSKKDFTKIENNNNDNSITNNKIDFNVFLNEKCKNAINMSYLIETIVIGLKDIENIEKQGYVKTITDMVVEKLKDYSIYERPLHYYIDDKTYDEETEEEIPYETIHIKENDKWNEEDMSEHDVLLTNLNTLNDVLQERTKGKERLNQEVKSGRRYNKTGKIITNILDTVKIGEPSR